MTPGSPAGYTLGPPIGSGSTATVYRAERGAETVAVKILHPHLASDPAVRGRFLREVTIARRLEHPLIVRVFDLVSPSDPEEPPALVMELCAGGSLVGWRASGLEEILRLAHDVTSSLAAAHAVGIVHRDLKPSNVLRDGERFRVCDFGSAGVQDSVSLSTSSLFVDAPVYVAPEVFEGHPADPRSDLYSMGAILYEAATGKKARDRALPRSTEPATARAERPDRGALDASLPVWLADLVMALLSPLETRPPDAATVLRALERGRVESPAALKRCLFCGAAMPAPAPLCLGCGQLVLGLAAPEREEAYCVTLRAIREDAATLERVTGIFRSISGNPAFELELMFGDPRYYSREERKRKRKLPVRIVEGLSAEDAERLRRLLEGLRVRTTVHAMSRVKPLKQGPLIPAVARLAGEAAGREKLKAGSRSLEALGRGPGRDLATRLLFAIYGLEEAARGNEMGDLLRAFPRTLHALARKLVDDLALMEPTGVRHVALQAEVVRTTALAESGAVSRSELDAALGALERHEDNERRKAELSARVLGLCGALEGVARDLTATGPTRADDVRRALEDLEAELSRP